MLLCPLNEVEPGMVLAASVSHPTRPDCELLRMSVALEPAVIARLQKLGVRSVWVNHDALADLDHLDLPRLSEVRTRALNQLREDFQSIACQTVSTSQVLAYKQVVMELICELMSGKGVCGLTDHLMTGPEGMFTHGANVAYLSLILGLELETYIVRLREKLANERARDLTSLGIGAMLHDIGKATLEGEARRICGLHAFDESDAGKELESAYQAHAIAGYEMLRISQAPASAKQIVLNHHQRWDGQGFPDMTVVTRGRHTGTQQGDRIHVLTRIATAANVLDNLLTEAKRNNQPVIAALHAFGSERFEGWFDPIVRDAALRCLPPFPMGAAVRLSDNQAAAVVAPCLEQPCRPTVRLLTPDSNAGFASLDLREHPDLTIVECDGLPTTRYLFTLEERPPLARLANEQAA